MSVSAQKWAGDVESHTQSTKKGVCDMKRANIMRKNKHLTFQFFENEADAVEFENGLKASERGSVTPWTSQDGAEHKTIAWYYY